MQTVALVDLGMGNLRSVERALARAADDAGVPCAVARTGDPDAVARADKIVVPGQGAFRDCAAALARGLGDALRARIQDGAPYFGICLGLQALFDGSEEAPGAAGLGVFAGEVVRLVGGGVKIPHMGWNQIALVREVQGPLRVFAGRFNVGRDSAFAGPSAGDAPFVYFVHSFHAVPRDPSLIAAVAEHGPHRITAAIERGNVTAVQFHPEKSQAAGLRLLGSFLAG